MSLGDEGSIEQSIGKSITPNSPRSYRILNENENSEPSVATTRISHYQRIQSDDINKRLRAFAHLSKQIAEKNSFGKDFYISVILIELFVYIVFLIIASLIIFLPLNPWIYEHNKMISNVFLYSNIPETEIQDTNFVNSPFVEDFWKYMESIGIDGLYGKTIYFDSLPIPITDTEKKILYENKILGRARLRQLRVKSTTCPNTVTEPRSEQSCFPSYSELYEDKNVATHTFNFSGAEFAWNYQNEEELEGSTHWGTMNTYSGGGYIVILPKFANDTKEILAALKKEHWVTISTRAVFLDFTIYNPSQNLYSIIRLLWEFPPTGGLTTSWKMTSFSPLEYKTSREKFILALEIFFIMFTFCFLAQEIIEFTTLGYYNYFHIFSTFYDLILITFCFICIGLNIHKQSSIARNLQQLSSDPDIYPNFESRIGYWENAYHVFSSFTLFFLWLKLFRYISFNKIMTELLKTLVRCAKDIGGYISVFFLGFIAFVQIGYLVFGSNISTFKTFLDSAYTLYLLILKDFNYKEVEESYKLIGPIFFITYVYFICFILFNMFLAIIIDTFTEVKSGVQISHRDFALSDFCQLKVNSCFEYLKIKKIKSDEELQRKLDETERQISYNDLELVLKRKGFKKSQIKIYLARFGIYRLSKIDENDALEILKEIDGEDQSHIEEEKIDIHHHVSIAKSKGQTISVPIARQQSIVKRLENLEVLSKNLFDKVTLLSESFNE